MSEIMRQIWTPQMQIAFTVVVLLIVCLYVLSIVWISRDARLRGVPSMKWVIIGLIPGAGIIAYLLLRPPMLAMDRDEQELEVALKQRELMKYGECVKCGYPVRDDYVVCPNCQTQLRNICSFCSRPLEPAWPICPYCTTPVSSNDLVENNISSRSTKHRGTTRNSSNSSKDTQPSKNSVSTNSSDREVASMGKTALGENSDTSATGTHHASNDSSVASSNRTTSRRTKSTSRSSTTKGN